MIKLEGLGVRNRDGPLLEAASLTINAGEAVALLGLSGSGKSLLLEVIAGNLPPAAGRVVLGSTGQEPPRVGYAGALPAAWPVIRCDEFLELVARPRGLAGQPLREAIRRGLDFAGCGHRRDERIDRLPDGRRKQLLIASAMLHDPEILLLDNPFALLDAPGREDVSRAIADFTLAGGVVLATADGGGIENCFGRAILLEAGGLLDTSAQGAADWPEWSRSLLADWHRRR